MGDPVEINCEATGKILAKRDEKGIYLWCKVCKDQHFIPWPAEDEEGQSSYKLASEADLCYNLNR
jgi:hypothetical protein